MDSRMGTKSSFIRLHSYLFLLNSGYCRQYMGISGLAIQALPKQNSASMNTAQNQQRLEQLNHQDNWHITYLQLYASTNNFVFNFSHCLNVLSVCEIYKAKFPVICCSHIKNISRFSYLLSWQSRSYIGDQRKGFFGEFWFGFFFQRNRWIRRK